MRSDFFFKMRTDATRILRVPRLRSNRVSDVGHRETHVKSLLRSAKGFKWPRLYAAATRQLLGFAYDAVE